MLARLLVPLLLLAASVAHGAVTTTDSLTVQLKRGSTIVGAFDDQVACEESKAERIAAEALTRFSGSATYSCIETRRTVARFSAAPPPPPPTCPPLTPPASRSQTCPAPTVGTWQQDLSYTSAYPECSSAWLPEVPPDGMCAVPPPPPVDCVVSAWGEWTGGAWSTCANGTQSRQETRARTVLTQPSGGGAACPALSETRTASQSCTVEPTPGAITHLPVVCSANVATGATITSCGWASQSFRPAGPDSMVRACTGSTCSATSARWRRYGGLSVTGSVEVCTQPKSVGDPVQGGSCASSTSTWGAMAYVRPPQVAQSAAPPPPASGWTHCADEGDHCSFTGTLEVRYGAGSAWTEPQSFTGGVNCTNSVFGDPLPGTVKRCEMRPIVVGIGTATIEWTPPTLNTDGSTLTNLAGYYVHYGERADVLHQTLTVSSATATSATVNGLTAGTWYFAVRAYASTGAQSDLSNVDTKTVQ